MKKLFLFKSYNLFKFSKKGFYLLKFNNNLSNKKLYKTQNYNFSENYSFLNKEEVNKMVDNHISKINTDNFSNIDFTNIYKSLELLGNVSDVKIIKQANESILKLLRNNSFTSSLTPNYLSALIAKGYALNLTEGDLDIIENLYFNVKDQLTDEIRIFIFESLYFYERKKYKMDWIKEDMINYFKNNLKNLNADLTKVFLRSLLFLSDEDTFKLSEALNKFIDNVLDSNKEFLQQLDYMVFFPKPLYVLNSKIEIKDKLDYKNKINRIEKFLIENRKNELMDDNIVCLLSNFNHYIEFRTDILELYIPILYRLLSKFSNEFLIEVFFLYLQVDINKIVNIDMLKTFLKKIEEVLKREKALELFIPEVSKEEIFYHDCKDQLKAAFNEFKLKYNDTKISEEFEDLMNKAIFIFPFASKEYDVKLIEKIYKNYLRLLN